MAEYLYAIGEYESGEENEIDALRRRLSTHRFDAFSIMPRDELDKAIVEYLSGLSQMGCENIKVHAPTSYLLDELNRRIQDIGTPHSDYLAKLAKRAAPSLDTSRLSHDDLKLNAVAGAVMTNRRTAHAKAEIAKKGKLTQCQECAQWVHMSESERIKPYGANRYLRLCSKCATLVKQVKELYSKKTIPRSY